MNRKPNLMLLVALVALVVATQGCGVINKLRAKNSLNEGVREFNKGKYEAAGAKFDEAVKLSPDLANVVAYLRSLGTSEPAPEPTPTPRPRVRGG